MTSPASSIDWHSFPLTMRAEHLVTIYGFTLLGIKKMAQKRNPKIPTPSTSRPFGWNRDDVIRHYSRRVA
jgi:hypothetical protein